MKYLLSAICISGLFLVSPAQAEKRCGWVINPTPSNWWLDDADGSWTIAMQGGYQADGMDNMPDFSSGDWIVTNGTSYGYGCACMDVQTERGDEKRILRIKSVRQLSIAKCEKDPNLVKPQ